MSESKAAIRVLSVLRSLASIGAGLVGAGLLLVAAGRRTAELRALPVATLAPDQVIGALAQVAAGLLLFWLAVCALLALVAALPTSLAGVAARWSARVTPSLLRSVVAAVVGGSVAVGATATATATAAVVPTARPTQIATVAHAASPVTPATSGPALPDPGWTPEPPPPPPLTRPGDVSLVSATAAPGRAVEDHVAVRRGDTLWTIAARHLGPAADPAQIAREWPRWYAANRRVIGPDPDLLHPGQVLRPPAQTGTADR